MRPIDLIIISTVALAFIFAIRKVIKDNKAGKTCGSCHGCSHAKVCGEIERN